MTTIDHQILIDPFIKKADEDNDPYLIVHFSRDDDYFEGTHDRMDIGDALIVIKHLVKDFNISSQALVDVL